MSLLGVFLVSGCSLLFGEATPFHDPTLDYQKATTIPAMQANPAKKITFESLMPIPAVSLNPGFKPTKMDPIPKPPLLIHLDEQSGLALVRKNQQEWLVISQPAAVVWEKLQQFWQQKKIALQIVDLQSGVIETAWLKQHPFKEKLGFWANLFHQDPDLEKFRMQLVADDAKKTSVLLSYVQISHDHQAPQRWDHLSKEDLAWQHRSDNQSVRGQALQALTQWWVQDEGVLINGQYLKPRRITLSQDGNRYPVLELEQSFSPAWSNIGWALHQAKIQVDDLDRSLGIYYIRYDRSDKKPVTAYEVKVSRAEKDIHVTVQVNDDVLAPVELSTEILNHIKQALDQ